ncbi:MAG: hypothetical protein VW378_05115 [bacterium]
MKNKGYYSIIVVLILAMNVYAAPSEQRLNTALTPELTPELWDRVPTVNTDMQEKWRYKIEPIMSLLTPELKNRVPTVNTETQEKWRYKIGTTMSFGKHIINAGNKKWAGEFGLAASISKKEKPWQLTMAYKKSSALVGFSAALVANTILILTKGETEGEWNTAYFSLEEGATAKQGLRDWRMVSLGGRVELLDMASYHKKQEEQHSSMTIFLGAGITVASAKMELIQEKKNSLFSEGPLIEQKVLYAQRQTKPGFYLEYGWQMNYRKVFIEYILSYQNVKFDFDSQYFKGKNALSGVGLCGKIGLTF